MRPSLLDPLFVAAAELPGVGKHRARFLHKLGIDSVADLAWHLPSGVERRTAYPSILAAPTGATALLSVTVDQHLPPTAPRRPYRVRVRDESGFLTLSFFHARSEYLARMLPMGERRRIAGKIEAFGQERTIHHPDFLGNPDDVADTPPGEAEPIYPLTAGLTPKVMARLAALALDKAPALPEWLEPALLLREGWADWLASLRRAHAPVAETDLAPTTPWRRRLAYDELLANQLALALVRDFQRTLPGRALVGSGKARQAILDALPYRLTASQTEALAEIDADLTSERRMLRLLQGDVGSGKTVVALLTLAAAVDAGCQGALMAPTDLLARQHLESIRPLAEAAGLRIALLTGRDKGKGRAALLDDIAAGRIDIVIGTHALFQDDVAFHDLAVAVIDEQHRFGVHQRLSLSAKGRGVDVLVMTATPIPRTLQLTAYGDLDVSRLTEKPAGRKPIATRVLPLDRLEEVIDAVGRAMAGGARVYWVCPLVEESDQLDLAAATARFDDLRQHFGPAVGLVHGQMKPADRDAAMADFVAGRTQLLVATTVIEVGVNVPEATVMVIEHAERYGLAQLHQLRGRIGRGSDASTCLLLYTPPLGEVARARLTIMRDSEDGFHIAEEDLRLRGGGEVLGLKQSGLPEFRLADLAFHTDLLDIARAEAKLILTRDPDLQSPRGAALRCLLYLFERDTAARYLRSG